MEDLGINALAGWFGNNRTHADTVGIELGPLKWCGVPFAGGCPELPRIRTKAGLASDLHRHIINIARVVRDPVLKAAMVDRLDGMLFHPDELLDAQRRCVAREGEGAGGLFGAPKPNDEPDVAWAADYFVTCWMGRGGHSGKEHEFTQGLSFRWTTSGGDSAKRFRSAVESLSGWHRALAPWSFACIDVFDFLENVVDQPGHGLYLDPPWPELGKEYRHKFDDTKQARLVDRLAAFKHVRIVVRFGDHPLIRKLYPEGPWTWSGRKSKNQTGNTVEEVLLINGPSLATEAA